jgi:glycosyltransferase involved in cell wall biosynthesis
MTKIQAQTMKQTLWLDITTIYGWSTTAVGIVRMEMECAAYALYHLGSSVRFCRFDREHGYVVVDSQELNEILSRLKNKAKLQNFAHHFPAKYPTRLALWKHRVNKVIHVLPATVANRIWSFGAQRKHAVLALYRAWQEIRSALKEAMHPSLQRSIQSDPVIAHALYGGLRAPFEKGDVYISMGLDWDQKDLPYLYAQKRAIGFKAILFCYDIIPILLPHLCVGNVAAAFGKYFADVAWCADQLFCISDQSKVDLTGFLKSIGTPVPEMQVVHLGCDLVDRLEDSADLAIASLMHSPYLLFVSTIERRKNHEVLYRAYIRLIEAGTTNLPKLVFAGKMGWGVQDFLADLQYDPRIAGYIQILHYVTDADLSYLYRHAYFTVFPSLYEGWGLPVAESLMSGKFCLASNSASIPEVGDDFVEYIEPWDVNAWANRIAYYVDHPEEVKKREMHIAQHYQPITWQAASEQLFIRAQELV